MIVKPVLFVERRELFAQQGARTPPFSISLLTSVLTNLIQPRSAAKIIHLFVYFHCKKGLSDYCSC